VHRLLASLAHLSFAASAFLCASAFGASPAQQPAPQAVEPIAVAEIPARADADERFIRDLVTRARQPDPAERLVAPLEALVADVRQLSEASSHGELHSLSAMELASLERYWRFYDDQLAAWRGELQHVTARDSEATAELARRRARWEATRTAAATGGLPGALGARVDAILAEVAGAEAALSGRLDSHLQLASQGNSAQVAVDSSRNAVHAAFEDFGRRLLVIDAPPLAEAWRNRMPASQALAPLTLRLAIQDEFLAKYYSVHAWKPRVLGGAALALLALLLWVSRRSGTLVPHDDPRMQSSAPVLQRPISSWLVLVLLCVLYFDRDAPMIVQRAALLLAPLPVLRLLPRRGYAVLGPWPYIATALYLLYQLGFLAIGTPILGRLHLLVTGMLTLAALPMLLLRLRSQARASFAGPRSTALRAVAWLFGVATFIGVIADVVGSVSLAESLIGGVVVSGYVGLVLYVASAVLDAILTLLLKRPAAGRLGIVARHSERLLQSLGSLLNVAALAVWVVVALKSFHLYQPVADAVRGVLGHPLELGQISVTLGDVLLFLVSVWVSLWFAKLTRIALRDAVLPNIELPHGASNSIATLSYYAVAIVGLLVALAATGLQLSQLTIVVGALSVGIGFGLQNIVNNFVSGLILMFERPIQPGDVVEVAGASGTVREIGMRATRLRTSEGADIVVPNGTLLSQNLLNWTLSDKSRRLDVNVGVAFGGDLKRVLEILMDAATTTPGLATSPAPSVKFVGIGASSLNFAISAWTDDFSSCEAVRSSMMARVYDALMAAGIEMPFPQQDPQLRSLSP
jgi:potassium-dependent mechanosensitive channel